jgi:CheY-like chemotaxis protein
VPKILVADDNANIQKMVALAFEERGIQVVTVANGEAAVRRLPDLLPDLVLADIFMPVRNGYEVCEYVKKDERFAHIPVILLVGAFDPLDEKEARRVGADGVLKKPFVPPDPLIAMVMSVLEKNPRVVAEMAKAKAAKEVLASEPVTQLEIPSRVEPKPLPDFPEPATPEEAAIAYGFGTGKRALGLEKAEAGPEAPVEEIEEVGEDEFEGSSTSRDWRRTAMDFEVPMDAANMPGFSASGGDLDATAMFPSERDVPPRRVTMPEPLEEAAPVVHDTLAPVQQVEAVSPESFDESPAAPEVAEAPAVHEVKDAEQAVRDIAVVAAEPPPEPSFASKTPHWMDAVAATQADYPQRDWMNALSDRAALPPAEPAAETEVHAAAFSDSERQDPEPSQSAEPNISLALPMPPIQALLGKSEPVLEAPQDAARTSHEVSDDPFFADEPEPTPSAAKESWFAPAPPVFEPLDDAPRMHVPFSSAPSNSIRDLDSDEADAAPSLRDPDLEQPVGVRVTHEALLIDEEPHAPTQYGSRSQELPPLHSFLPPASAGPAVEEPLAQDFRAHGETPVPSFEPRLDEWNERTPTGPPPNREALAGIPFLTPPPAFRPDANETLAMDPETIDAVVRKVLERLEPQIHDLLSQGVLKPLVENLLQQELAKKER